MIPALVSSTGYLYRKVMKPLFFKRDPELVHARATATGELLGRSALTRAAIGGVFRTSDPLLAQDLFGIGFKTPIGLAAGFDYEARLTQILPSLGFGFGSVGTITNEPYEGNPGPMLGRLPRSRSLMVNKGFKNDGVHATMRRLGTRKFLYPVGVSIGKTNTAAHKTQSDGVRDVVSAFRAAEASGVPFAYYELNVSCPNVADAVEFYKADHLDELLLAISKLGIGRPVFIKMPISKTDDEVRSMMRVIVRHPFVSAVIIGNLQRDRTNPAIVKEEVERFPTGNFSGVPCRARSDELIALVHREFGAKIKVIGCGGVFSAEDAYRKIRLGASLVQLITGLIFQGPQLVAEINRGIAEFMKRDGFASVEEAVGTI